MIEHVFPLRAIKLALLVFVGSLCALLTLWLDAKAAKALIYSKRRALKRCSAISAVVSVFCFAAAISGCADTINPVRFQPVEYIVTRPCLAGKAAPVPATRLIAEECDASGENCRLRCALASPAECVRAAEADLIELKREARESRNLIEACQK